MPKGRSIFAGKATVMQRTEAGRLHKRIAELETERDNLRQQVLRLREGWKTAETELAKLNEQYESLAEEAEAMEAYIPKLQEEKRQLEAERDRLRKAAQQALSFIDGTDLRTAPLARSTAQALREALNKADTDA